MSLTQISPAIVAQGQETTVVIEGAGFLQNVLVDLDHAAASRLTPAIAVRLEGPVAIALKGERLVGARLIEARVPASAPPGRYTVRVTLDGTRGAALERGLLVACEDLAGCAPADSSAAPEARFSVAPARAAVGAAFSFDATASRTRVAGGLRVRWNFDAGEPADTGFDTAFAPLAEAGLITHVYQTEGLHRVALEAQDDDGVTSRAEKVLTVIAPGGLSVTTLNDEADLGATPDSPGSGGLSLREALAYAHDHPEVTSIDFGALAGAVILSAPLALSASHALWIVGTGVTVDGGGLAPGENCIDISGASQWLYGVRVQNCPAAAVSVAGDNNVVSGCTLDGTTRGAEGIDVQSASAHVGPDNQITGFATSGIALGAAATVFGNRLRQNGVGLTCDTVSGASIWQNIIDGSAGAGVSLQKCTSGVIWHNTFLNNGAGFSANGAAKGNDVRNNIFAFQAQAALDAPREAFAKIAGNDFFKNGSVGCGGCSIDNSNLAVDPALGVDYRPGTTSGVVDRGVAVDLDVNGALPGDFNGDGPDIGAVEY